MAEGGIKRRNESFKLHYRSVALSWRHILLGLIVYRVHSFTTLALNTPYIMRLIIPSLLALIASVRAVGIAVVLNNSPDPIYVWSVGGTVGPRHDIKAGRTHASFDLVSADSHRRYLLGGDAP